MIYSIIDDLRKCPHCASDRIVKNGHNPQGKQQYRCKQCGKTGVLNPSRRYSPEDKERILSAYYHHPNPSVRGIARSYGVTRETISAWLRKNRESQKNFQV